LQAPLSVYVGSQSCPIVSFTSSQIICTLPAGKGFNIPIQVTSSGLLGVPATLLSYAPPSINRIQGCTAVNNNSLSIVDCQRAGGQTITLEGSDFGDSNALVLVGSDRCTNVQHDTLTPHDKLTCVLPQGNRADRPVLVFQSGGELSRTVVTLSYVTCKPGEYELTTLNCTSTPAGRYSNTENAAQALECFPGRFAQSSRMSFCSFW
jgi:hypothetical protein